MGHRTHPYWSGLLRVGPGWALLDSVIGDNCPHAHLAPQIILPRGPAVSVETDARKYVLRDRALYLPSSIRHKIGPINIPVRSLYLDPFFTPKGREKAKAPFFVSEAASQKLAEIEEDSALSKWCDHNLGVALRDDGPLRFLVEPTTADIRLTPAALARSMGVSPRVLRTKSLKAYGVTTRKLTQWVQLKLAARAVAEGASLASAAHIGGFSDQAHFTRRLVQWFGVTPHAALANMELDFHGE